MKHKLHCGPCNQMTEAPVSWSFERFGVPRDPLLGCELRLTTNLRGRDLWAYNLEHLQWLRDYIGADLRERLPNANASMASRLPQWMVNAKNRDSVLKALDKLAPP